MGGGSKKQWVLPPFAKPQVVLSIPHLSQPCNLKASKTSLPKIGWEKSLARENQQTGGDLAHLLRKRLLLLWQASSLTEGPKAAQSLRVMLQACMRPASPGSSDSQDLLGPFPLPCPYLQGRTMLGASPPQASTSPVCSFHASFTSLTTFCSSFWPPPPLPSGQRTACCNPAFSGQQLQDITSVGCYT